MDINKYIGEKIREYRQRKNITQEELADFLGVTTQAVSRYELGKRKTDNDILFKLADYFKISINDFFPPLNETKKNAILEAPNEQKEVLKQTLKDNGIIDENDNISNEDFNRLMKFIDNNKDLLIKKE